MGPTSLGNSLFLFVYNNYPGFRVSEDKVVKSHLFDKVDRRRDTILTCYGTECVGK